MARRPGLRMAPALSLTRNRPHSAGISQRKMTTTKTKKTNQHRKCNLQISKITREWSRDPEPAFLSFFFFQLSWYTIRQVHSSTEFPRINCLVLGTEGIGLSPSNQVFWLVIRPKKNTAGKCCKNKAGLLPFHRGVSEKNESNAGLHLYASS